MHSISTNKPSVGPAALEKVPNEFQKILPIFNFYMIKHFIFNMFMKTLSESYTPYLTYPFRLMHYIANYFTQGKAEINAPDTP